MRQTTSQTLFTYWNEARGSRLAPRRFDIEPALLSSILSETFILERASAERYTYRLAGTRICELFGGELRGTDFLDGLPHDDAGTIARQMDGPLAKGAGAVFQLAAEPEDGGPATRFETIVLPLIHTGNTISRYLGATSVIDAPIWLGTRPLPPRSLAGHQLIWPEGARTSQHLAPPADEPPPLSVLAGARLVKVDRRSFRILDGGLSGSLPGPVRR